MPVRFLISTLKDGVDPAEYEQWVRERDYALVRTLPNYLSYQVHRISVQLSCRSTYVVAGATALLGQAPALGALQALATSW